MEIEREHRKRARFQAYQENRALPSLNDGSVNSLVDWMLDVSECQGVSQTGRSETGTVATGQASCSTVSGNSFNSGVFCNTNWGTTNSPSPSLSFSSFFVHADRHDYGEQGRSRNERASSSQKQPPDRACTVKPFNAMVTTGISAFSVNLATEYPSPAAADNASSGPMPFESDSLGYPHGNVWYSLPSVSTSLASDNLSGYEQKSLHKQNVPSRYEIRSSSSQLNCFLGQNWDDYESSWIMTVPSKTQVSTNSQSHQLSQRTNYEPDSSLEVSRTADDYTDVSCAAHSVTHSCFTDKVEPSSVLQANSPEFDRHSVRQQSPGLESFLGSESSCQSNLNLFSMDEFPSGTSIASDERSFGSFDERDGPSL